MSLPYKKTESFAVGAKVFPTEIEAIRECIGTRIGNNVAIAKNITDSAKDLIPLLQRVVALSEEKQG